MPVDIAYDPKHWCFVYSQCGTDVQLLKKTEARLSFILVTSAAFLLHLHPVTC